MGQPSLPSRVRRYLASRQHRLQNTSLNIMPSVPLHGRNGFPADCGNWYRTFMDSFIVASLYGTRSKSQSVRVLPLEHGVTEQLQQLLGAAIQPRELRVSEPEQVVGCGLAHGVSGITVAGALGIVAAP